MKDRIVMITGATSGIGKATARALADMEARVVLVGRNQAKCEDTLRWITRETRNPNVECMLADLSSQEQIRRLADEFRIRYPRLDVLVNNAGALFLKRLESVDGIEMTFALNHLSCFLLTNLLLDRLKAADGARIINVSSRSHENAVMDFDDLQCRREYSGMKAYGRSKLANLLFTFELARRLEGTGVTVNALHPGFVATNFGMNNNDPLAKAILWLMHLGARSPEKGAETVIYLASSPRVDNVSGKYFVDKKVVASSAASLNPETAEKLWRASEELVKLPVTM
jgi:NAD(P)-dependent dehydrogenase (short-subunit alcohol dehydrogenase family)